MKHRFLGALTVAAVATAGAMVTVGAQGVLRHPGLLSELGCNRDWRPVFNKLIPSS